MLKQAAHALVQWPSCNQVPLFKILTECHQQNSLQGWYVKNGACWQYI